MSNLIMIAVSIAVSVALVDARPMCRSGTDSERDDVKALQGSWIVISQVANGTTIDQKELAGSKVLFSGDQITFLVGDTVRSKATIILEEDKTPKLINLTDVSPIAGVKSHGIYELHGDELKLCIGPGNKDRPKRFEAPKGTFYIIDVLKKEKNQRAWTPRSCLSR
jgi:uncharacterized protein (TIGR03067 family)